MIAGSLLCLCASAQAQGFSRKGRFETYVGGQYQSGVSSMLEDAPTEIEFRNTGLVAMGFGYHFHDHFAANLNFAFGGTRMTLDGPEPDDTLKQDAYLFNGSANIDYNILKRPFTPLITGGIGWNMFETQIPGAPPEYICYPGYPYWWCTYGYPTYSEWEFAGNFGVGFRWEINENLFLKGVAATTITRLTNTTDAFKFIQGTLTVGWSY
jgi:opacity protein-like surface antigen